MVKRNCLWIFSLQTGISILIVVDLFALVALIALFVFSTIADMKDGRIKDNKDNRTGYLSF